MGRINTIEGEEGGRKGEEEDRNRKKGRKAEILGIEIINYSNLRTKTLE